MKKIIIFLLFFFTLWGLTSMPAYAVDGGVTPDSVMFGSAYGSANGLDVGVPGYPDSLYADCGGPSGGECNSVTLISTTTPYTILNYAISHYPDGSNAVTVGCTGLDLPQSNYGSMFGTEGYGFAYTNSMQFHCSSDLVTSGSGDKAYVFVQYVPYDTRVVVTTPVSGPNYHDWILVACILIFLVSFSFWPRLFKPVTNLFYDS